MANFLTYCKKNYPNLYSLIVALLLAIWYNGITGLIQHIWPKKNFNVTLIFLLVPIIIFLTDDGNLDELYNSPGTQYPIIGSQQSNNRIPAIVAASVVPFNQSSIKSNERFSSN